MFVPAYSDVAVVLGGHRPIQVLTEIENCNSHLMRALADNEGNSDTKGNLEKAKRHLQRGTLDCYKLIWLQIDKQIEAFLGEFGYAELVDLLPVSYDEIYRRHKQFKRCLAENRRNEILSVGTDIEGSIAAYKKTVEDGYDLLQEISDEARYKRIKNSLVYRRLMKDAGTIIISVLLGGLLSHWLF